MLLDRKQFNTNRWNNSMNSLSNENCKHFERNFKSSYYGQFFVRCGYLSTGYFDLLLEYQRFFYFYNIKKSVDMCMNSLERQH